jgi:hypothetical protein
MLQVVARLCGRFNLDPVVVLASRDEFELNVRIAAARVVSEDERKANEASARSRAARPSSRGRRR